MVERGVLKRLEPEAYVVAPLHIIKE